MSVTRKRLLLAAVCGLILIPSVVTAQVPYVQVYFDSSYEKAIEVCQGVGVVQTWYVVATNLNTYIKAIEYSVSYPTAVTWLADLPVVDTIVFGTTPTGVGQAFTNKGNGFGPLLVIRVLVGWNCNDCDHVAEQYVVAGPHPGTGHCRAVRWPDDHLIALQGLYSRICGYQPVEPTTWGRIKALHE